MSHMSLSRSGYASHRSPSALAAAIALNGGLVALVIAIPVAQYVRTPVQPLITHDVRIQPRPIPDEPKPAVKPTRTEKPIHQQQPDERPTMDKPIIQLAGNDGVIHLVKPPLIDETGGIGTLPYNPPADPVFVAARPDPRYADTFHPDYPPSLRREGLEGSVTVRITIDDRGRVIAVEQIRATNAAFFEETKRQALKEWRFKPATRDGVAVRAEQTMTVHFRLED